MPSTWLAQHDRQHPTVPNRSHCGFKSGEPTETITINLFVCRNPSWALFAVLHCKSSRNDHYRRPLVGYVLVLTRQFYRREFARFENIFLCLCLVFCKFYFFP